jgi:thiol-disulfide isomerase/thioredoxin
MAPAALSVGNTKGTASMSYPDGAWGWVLFEADKKVVIEAIIPGASAQIAGAQPGDILVKVADQDISNLEQYAEQLGERTTLKTTILRGEERRELTLNRTKRSAQDHPLVGTRVPDAELAMITSRGDKKLSQYGSKTLILEFWTTWCGPCRRSATELNALQKKLGSRATLIGVTSESEELVRNYLESRGPKGPQFAIGLDTASQLHRALDIQSYPTIVVVGTDMVVRGVFRGTGQTRAIASLVK